MVVGDFVEQKGWYGGTGETKLDAANRAAAAGANAVPSERSRHRVTSWSWAYPYTEGKLLWLDNYEAVRSGQATTVPPSSIAARLKELNELHRQGLVTDSEYEVKRKAIVDAL